MAVVTYTSPGSGLWLCPGGVFWVAPAAWGGGGPGQAGAANGGDGGGGGEYAAEPLVAVTPGTLYRWTVASGGTGVTAGGTTTFTGDTLTVAAHGGARGAIRSGGTGSTNTTHHDGGAGGTSAFQFGGGGGSSAGPSAAGGNGGNATSGGSSGPGAGGTPPAGGAAGGAGGSGGGFFPGGGGGGASGPFAGGGGGAGMLELTYAAPTQPQVPFFPAGYAPLPQDWDNWLQAPLSFLTGKIVFRAEQTAALSLPIGATTLIPFNSILEDPYHGWEPGSSQWLCPAGQSGIYTVALTVSCAPNASKPVVAAQVGLNSAASLYSVDRAWVPPTTGQPGIASGSIPLPLFGGSDSVQGYAFLAGATSTVATTAGQRCQMTITWQAL